MLSGFGLRLAGQMGFSLSLTPSVSANATADVPGQQTCTRYFLASRTRTRHARLQSVADEGSHNRRLFFQLSLSLLLLRSIEREIRQTHCTYDGRRGWSDRCSIACTTLVSLRSVNNAFRNWSKNSTDRALTGGPICPSAQSPAGWPAGRTEK